MQYLTYEEYKSMGGELNETAFLRHIDRACAVIDAHTYGRLLKVSEISRKVKACVRDLVEYLANSGTNGKTVTSKSQSAGGVSESEIYATKIAEDISSEMFGFIYEYLSTETDDNGTPLLYRGCMC